MIWRAEICDVDLGVPVGREPADLPLGVIISADLINSGPGPLVSVVPITSTDAEGVSDDLRCGHLPFREHLLSRCDVSQRGSAVSRAV